MPGKVFYDHNGTKAQWSFVKDQNTEYRKSVLRYTFVAYGYLLNTRKRRRKWFTFKEFAQFIRDYYSVENPRNAEVVRVLEVS